MIKTDFVIVGGGPSGLTLAYKLLEARKSVILIERDKRIGGLAKSFNYDGNIFDLGPKRFHTDDDKVTEFISSIMHLIEIDRSTLVCFFKRYLDWPLRRRDLLKLPPTVALRSAFDILTKKPAKDKNSFPDFIKSKYGNTLYNTFFKPYTSKFLRWDPEDLHSDWASTGINRAVIDEEVSQKTDTTLSIIKSLILPAKVDTRFKYPESGGFGNFFDILYSNCQAYANFTSLLNSTIDSIDNNGDKKGNISIKVGDKEISTSKLVWTGNLNDLNKLIISTDSKISSSPKMNYLNTRFVNLTLKEKSVATNKAQWIYVSDGSLLTSRITCMKEFNPNTCNYGYYNIICEVTESQSQTISIGKRLEEKQLGLKVIDELKDIGFLRTKSSVEDFNVEDIKDTYPIYSRDYKKRFGKSSSNIKKYSNNIHLLGRSGAFWYNNSDHSIRQALDMSEFFLGKLKNEFNYRGYFGGEDKH